MPWTEIHSYLQKDFNLSRIEALGILIVFAFIAAYCWYSLKESMRVKSEKSLALDPEMQEARYQEKIREENYKEVIKQREEVRTQWWGAYKSLQTELRLLHRLASARHAQEVGNEFAIEEIENEQTNMLTQRLRVVRTFAEYKSWIPEVVHVQVYEMENQLGILANLEQMQVINPDLVSSSSLSQTYLDVCEQIDTILLTFERFLQRDSVA